LVLGENCSVSFIFNININVQKKREIIFIISQYFYEEQPKHSKGESLGFVGTIVGASVFSYFEISKARCFAPVEIAFVLR
jgi:hypothetical protein